MKKAQSIIEYSLVLGIVALAISAMQFYIKRGIQAGVKVAADELAKQEQNIEFDIKKGGMLISGQRLRTMPSQEDYTSRREIFSGGRQEFSIDEKSEVLPFDGEVPEESPDRSFFEVDKRAGTGYYQGFDEEFIPE